MVLRFCGSKLMSVCILIRSVRNSLLYVVWNKPFGYLAGVVKQTDWSIISDILWIAVFGNRKDFNSLPEWGEFTTHKYVINKVTVTGSEQIYALVSVPQRWSILRYQYIQDGDVQDIPQHQVNFNQSHKHDKLKKSNTKRMQGWSTLRLAMFSRT